MVVDLSKYDFKSCIFFSFHADIRLHLTGPAYLSVPDSRHLTQIWGLYPIKELLAQLFVS